MTSTAKSPWEASEEVAPDPMEIWNEVHSTPTKYTKEASNGRFSFTTIDPQWQLEQATRLFGPYGDTWGLFDLDFKTLSHESCPVMMLSATFKYPSRGIKHSFPIVVDMRFKPGDDCCKKLMTSARSKALSYLGFGADVFMGKFDDAHYVQMQDIKADQDKFLQTALTRVAMANTAERLAELDEKTAQMVTDETITKAAGMTISQAIQERLGEL